MLFHQGGGWESIEALPITKKNRHKENWLQFHIFGMVINSVFDRQSRLLVCNTEADGTEKANTVISRLPRRDH